MGRQNRLKWGAAPADERQELRVMDLYMTAHRQVSGYSIARPKNMDERLKNNGRPPSYKMLASQAR